MIKRVFTVIFSLLIPFFAFANTEGLIDWEEAFSGFHQEFLKSLLFFFKIAWPYLVGLIILKIVFKKLESKIIEWKKNKKNK
jgi:hypothetical protein